MIKKIITGVMCFSLILPLAYTAEKADAVAQTKEVVLEKSAYSNPIGCKDDKGNRIYGGDPSVLVDGDTVYLYVGHDDATDAQVGQKIYNMDGWICYSTKDLKDWKYEGFIMKENKTTVSWASSSSSAWAAQVTKHYNPTLKKMQYYFYYCTWDRTSQGKQSVGVAVADKPTGPFVDIGKPLVKGTLTTPQRSNWDDIDPTVWIEKDSQGVEHRYLAWGNSKLYVCELNEDMISVTDLNKDGKITSGSDPKKADIIERTSGLGFTEAPWLYRRQDANGNYYGKYYLFYASGWREKMAYSTTDNLLTGKWAPRQVIMQPTATSNTNHMSVFDFKGKTYFVYHNGSLPKGNGYRRSPCIRELTFQEDGTVVPMKETAAGLFGTRTMLYTGSGQYLGHENYVNSTSDSMYPYKKVKVGAGYGKEIEDSQWVLVSGKADEGRDAYVSIQSENKPGLYLTANAKNNVTLCQDTKGTTEMAKRQTFRTIEGIGNSDGITLESVMYPGYYLTIVNGVLTLSKGTDSLAATFYQKVKEGDSSLRSLAVTCKNNEIVQGGKIPSKKFVITAFYANGVTKRIPASSTKISTTSTKKTGTKKIQVTYEEQSVSRCSTVPVIVKVKPQKVKGFHVKGKTKKKKTTVTMSWKKPKGEYVEISYGRKKSQHRKLKTLKISKKKCTIKRSAKTWKKGKIYYFHIRTYTLVNRSKIYNKYVTKKVIVK